MINTTSQLLLQIIFLDIAMSGYIILGSFQPVHVSNALHTFFLILLGLLLFLVCVIFLATLVVLNTNTSHVLL